MKKTGLGILVITLILGMWLTSCAMEYNLVKDSPPDQRAKIYLVDDDAAIIKLDGQKLNFAWFFRTKEGILTSKIPGTNGSKTRDNEINWSLDVVPGEHSFTVTKKYLLVKTATVEGTYNFEAGKKYLLRVMTPSDVKESSLGTIVGDIGNSIKEGATGIYVLAVCESQRNGLPRSPDYSQNSKWVSISPPSAEEAQ